jgi:hypothetical protein
LFGLVFLEGFLVLLGIWVEEENWDVSDISVLWRRLWLGIATALVLGKNYSPLI